jgi:hypothetical protein
MTKKDIIELRRRHKVLMDVEQQLITVGKAETPVSNDVIQTFKDLAKIAYGPVLVLTCNSSEFVISSTIRLAKVSLNESLQNLEIEEHKLYLVKDSVLRYDKQTCVLKTPLWNDDVFRELRKEFSDYNIREGANYFFIS